VRGTLEIILRGWRRAQISKEAARELLQALPVRSTLHLRPEFMANVLEQIDRHKD
jgi:hypothetical protein